MRLDLLHRQISRKNEGSIITTILGIRHIRSPETCQYKTEVFAWHRKTGILTLNDSQSATEKYDFTVFLLQYIYK